MGFEDALDALATRVIDYMDTIQTEEATKTAVVLPFISQVLGYDVFNPSEVIPEYVCDIGTKKGEKIDFAIARGGEIQILIEMKKIGEPLNLAHASQLTRYFAVSKARIAVLTNGQYWWFYTDLERPNIMDSTPFLQLNLLAIDKFIVPELKKMTKETFDLESVLAAAEELKYVGAIKLAFADFFASPPEDFVKLIIAKVYEGKATPTVREAFTKLTVKAATQYINDRVNERLRTALNTGLPKDEPRESQEVAGADPTVKEVETTLDEIEGFNIVRAILASDVMFDRIFMRDSKSYCAILLDDNNRKTICRLHFNRSQKYIGLLNADKHEERIPIGRVEEIYQFADRLRSIVHSLSHGQAVGAA